MCSPRKVTFAPIAWSLRSLKFAMLFLARVSAGFWPVIKASSAFASSSACFTSDCEPTRSIDHDLLHLRNLVRVLVAMLLLQGRHHALFVIVDKIRSSIFSLSLSLASSFSSLSLSVFLRGFSLRAFSPRSSNSHIRDVNRTFALRDFPLGIVLRLLQVPLDHPHAFDQHALLARDDFEHLARGTFEVPGDHLDVVAFSGRAT